MTINTSYLDAYWILTTGCPDSRPALPSTLKPERSKTYTWLCHSLPCLIILEWLPLASGYNPNVAWHMEPFMVLDYLLPATLSSHPQSPSRQTNIPHAILSTLKYSAVSCSWHAWFSLCCFIKPSPSGWNILSCSLAHAKIHTNQTQFRYHFVYFIFLTPHLHPWRI